MSEFGPAEAMDVHWAHQQVSRGVKPVAILNGSCSRVPAPRIGKILEAVRRSLQDGCEADSCYLDTVRDPELAGKVYTSGSLLKPVLDFVMCGNGTYAVFFAANHTMADLLKWTFACIRNNSENARHAHAVVGLLCGYSSLAIEGFLEQPSVKAKSIAKLV